MEVGAHVWLRSESSRWGWVPAKITRKEDSTVAGGKLPVINLTLTQDNENDQGFGEFYTENQNFEVVVTVDPEQLKTAAHEDIKLRNLSRSFLLKDELATGSGGGSPMSRSSPSDSNNSNTDEDLIVGGVHDLIGLTHLHEPAILHALRLRYDSDIIYTSTGPILIAINPFKDMPVYTEQVMEQYRLQGEETLNGGAAAASSSSGRKHGHGNEHANANTPFKRTTNDVLLKRINRGKGTARNEKLPPHVYQTADDAYRAMMRGLENDLLMLNRNGSASSGSASASGRTTTSGDTMPTNQSILVSGESGAGKTVTTKIVLTYLAMLSKKASSSSGSGNGVDSSFASPNNNRSSSSSSFDSSTDDNNIESHVLQSNPILESFGNARTIRNDNSSRFGKYIDIRFTRNGKLTGASIETYLLEKVRLIHPAQYERNYHVFYQFLACVDRVQRQEFYLEDYTVEDFKLLSQTGTYDRRDGVSDADNHLLMLEAMVRIYSHDHFHFYTRLLYYCDDDDDDDDDIIGSKCMFHIYKKLTFSHTYITLKLFVMTS
jgi:myosin-5